MTQPAVLVIDVGTTVIKTSLFNFTCRTLDRLSRPHRTEGLDTQEAVEQLWEILREIVPGLAGRNAAYHIAAVGLTGYMHSVFPLDEEGRVLAFRPGDSEVRRGFDAVLDRFDLAEIYGITGSRLDVTSVPAQVLAWREHGPYAFAKIAHLLPIKDLLRYRLTGEMATDEIDACGTLFYDLRRRCWHPDLFGYCGLERKVLPPVRHCAERAGAVSRAASRELGLAEGTPVGVGGGDDIEILGSGAVAPRHVCEHAGSTGSFLLPIRDPRLDPTCRLELYPAVARDEWVLGGSCSNVTRALDWFLSGSSYGSAEGIGWDRVRSDLAKALAKVNSRRPFFLPYLYGERVPLWNPDLCAQWIGLRNHHGVSDMLLSVVEGICFSLRNVLDAYNDFGTDIETVFSSGGLNQLGAQRLRATIYGKPIRVVRGADPTSFATSALTLCSIGELSAPGEATRWLEFEPDVEPEPAWRDALQERFNSFVNLTRIMPPLPRESESVAGAEGCGNRERRTKC
jgi:xylulokinase